MPAAVASASGTGVWSRRRDEITFDRLQKFWHDLTPRARQDLLNLDKQTLIEHVRNNSCCSRCNGLLLDCFAQIAMYGKSLRQDVHLSRDDTDESRQVEEQDSSSSVHSPWGGLSTTKGDYTLTLLGCFIKAKSLKVLQNVFDNARERERERKSRYPDACGAGNTGRRAYRSREVCALHTVRPSCDALEGFWSLLDQETRSFLLRMREEDFVEKLTRRFNRKKFCRDCRKNVIREFKELKAEPKRTRRERRCNCWFCVDNGFHCEVFEDGIIIDWSQCLLEADHGSFHHFEWAIGTHEGGSDIFGFEDVGMHARVHKAGINLVQFQNYFITLRAWRSDERCTEYCVKAHVLKGKSCVHLQHTLAVSHGFVTVTHGESIKSFFERADKVDEEDMKQEGMNSEGNDLDADGSHTQKHAKSPELAREFLLDSASVIFKEQVVKAFRDDRAQQNAKSVFISLALQLLEERVHVACKEAITLEKQNKLLEEEEKEMRAEQEGRMKKRTKKDREKKQRQKQKLKEKLVESKLPPDDDMSSSTALNNSSTTSTNHESTATAPCSRDSANTKKVVDPCLVGRVIESSEQPDSQDHQPGGISDSQWQSIATKTKRRSSATRGCSSIMIVRVPKGGGQQSKNQDCRYSTHEGYSWHGAVGRDMNLKGRCPSSNNKLMKPLLGQKADVRPEDNGNTQEQNDASFSLFQFSLLQIASSPAAAASSEDSKTTTQLADRTPPLAQVRAQLCSAREQKQTDDVKEYKLFSREDSDLFSFMQIK